MNNITTRADWANRIQVAWQSSFDGIIECGRLLIAAKDELEHGEFLCMIEKELPFKRSTAQGLMKIAQDERITNNQHVGLLPPNWGTLVELSRLPDEIFEQKIADGTIHPEMQRQDVADIKIAARREERISNLAEISKGNEELNTDRRFPIIYADPPWRYENPPMGGSNRSIENHYPTMTLEEICALPVASLSTDDALLYLWATAPKLAECIEVITAWGFQYRTCFVWVKDKIGMGYHARNQHELLLVAKKGEIPPPLPENRKSSVLYGDRAEHSAKPDAFYELIEGMYPELPKIELFARKVRPGWEAWGNQAEFAA